MLSSTDLPGAAGTVRGLLERELPLRRRTRSCHPPAVPASSSCITRVVGARLEGLELEGSRKPARLHEMSLLLVPLLDQKDLVTMKQFWTAREGHGEMEMAAASSQGSRNQAHSSRRKAQTFHGVGTERLSTLPWQHRIPLPTGT